MNAPDQTTLEYLPAAEHLEDRSLLAEPVAAFLRDWAHLEQVQVFAIDPEIADTAALTAAAGLDLAESANCVVVGGRRAEVEKIAAAVILATTRADVNKTIRKHLDVRKASFLAMDEAVRMSGMEYGGITPIGLPEGWPVLIDRRVADSPVPVVVGSGTRGGKIRFPGELLAELPGAVVLDGMAVQV